MPNPAATAADAAPRRFRPRALPTIAMLAAVAICAAAGRWQQSRMEGKEALAAQLVAAQHTAPVAFAALPGAGDWSALRYRRVEASGQYVARAQILIDNRIHHGRAGYHVVAPLALDDARTVLVDRGWIALGASRAQPPEVPVPPGRVTIVGRIALPDPGYIELDRAAPSGPVWQNLDPARFAAATGIAVLPVVIEQTEAPQGDDGLAREWPAPDFGIEKHRIYMVQWYAFAALALGLWLFFNLRPRRAAR